MFKQVKSRISPNFYINNNINTGTVIAPKCENENHNVPKLKILPAPIKPSLNAAISFRTNNSMNNNCKYISKLYLK